MCSLAIWRSGEVRVVRATGVLYRYQDGVIGLSTLAKVLGLKVSGGFGKAIEIGEVLCAGRLSLEDQQKS